MAKETIALVGLADKTCSAIVHKLASGNYRLLLVSNQVNQLKHLLDQVMHDTPGAEVEIIDCVKNGCWEADIIVLIGVTNFEEELIGRIKAFATQKVVVGISTHSRKTSSSTFEATNLQYLMPNSKVVHVFYTSGSAEAFIAGDDREAVQTIAVIATKVGYRPITDSLQAITKL